MSDKIICLGGTGQMVLHYYLQLYLLGLIEHRFDAVVIDTDDVIDSLELMKRFFADLQYGNGPDQALGIEVPTITTVRVGKIQAGTALQRLSDSSDEAATRYHPARAFFDSETLAQDLKEGLFARPALSSVLSIGDVASGLAISDNATVAVVGSVIGGTGGGLIAPVIDELVWRAREANATVKVRAILFGRYFTPDPGRIDGSERRFYSNESLVLRSFGEALAEGGIERYHILRRAGDTDERKPDQEKRGVHLAWPDPTDERGSRIPFWEGAQALEYLLTDTVMERRVSFEDREVSEFKAPLPVSSALQQLRKSLQVARHLVERKVALRMPREPWLGTIWGDELPKLYAHYWGLAAQAAGSQERAGEFAAELQRALDLLWDGRKDEPGLRQVFPDLPRSPRIRPGTYAKLKWPRSQDAVRNRSKFDSLETTARRAAATLLFWCLREAI